MTTDDTQEPTAFGPYTPVRRAGNLYFISGQVGIDGSGSAAPDIQQQTVQLLKNMSVVLSEAGLQLDDVVKTTIFLKDIALFTTVNEIYETHFSEPRPARSCVEVAALPRIGNHELLIEIEAVAYKEQRS